MFHVCKYALTSSKSYISEDHARAAVQEDSVRNPEAQEYVVLYEQDEEFTIDRDRWHPPLPTMDEVRQQTRTARALQTLRIHEVQMWICLSVFFFLGLIAIGFASQCL